MQHRSREPWDTLVWRLLFCTAALLPGYLAGQADSAFDARADDIGRTYERQQVFLDVLNVLSEPSTVTPLLGFTHNLDPLRQKKPFIMNADVRTPVDMGGKRWRLGRVLHTVHIIPQFKVRIMQNDESQGDRSSPVRTPSYMPRITWFLARRAWFEDGRPSKHYVGFSLFHHSNGQDAPIFKGDSVNIYNGDFGEDLVFQFVYGGVRSYKGRENAIKGSRHIVSDREYAGYWLVGFEWHPSGLANQVLDSYDLYARYRLDLAFGFLQTLLVRDVLTIRRAGARQLDAERMEVRRALVNVTLLLDPDLQYGRLSALQRTPAVDGRRLNVTATVYDRTLFRSAERVALFLQASWFGSDPYNVYFMQRLIEVRAGIAWGVFVGDSGRGVRP